MFVPDSIDLFMFPSIGYGALLIVNARRLTGKAIRKLMQPTVLAVAVLIFATGIGNGVPQNSAITAEPAEHHHASTLSHQPVEQRLSMAQQPFTNKSLSHQRMTKALMTNHNLTAARFSSDSSTKRLPTDTDKTSQHG